MQALLLSAVAALPQATHPLEPEALFSSVVLTEGIRGGILGPVVRKRIEIGFDWEDLVFRVTVYRPSHSAEGSYLTATVPRDWFETLLTGALTRGLHVLPPQPNPDGSDVYGLDTGISLFHGFFRWENKASGGCAAKDVGVWPTHEELKMFADVVTYITAAIDDLELEHGCELDAGFSVPLTSRAQGRALMNALEHVLRSPLAHAVYRRQIRLLSQKEHDEVRFAWRGFQDFDKHEPRRRWYFGVRVDKETGAISDASSHPPCEPLPDHVLRRTEFLQERPDLPPEHQHLITAGWIVPGMTKEMVIASWGEPRAPEHWVYERKGDRVLLFFADDRLVAIQ